MWEAQAVTEIGVWQHVDQARVKGIQEMRVSTFLQCKIVAYLF